MAVGRGMRAMVGSVGLVMADTASVKSLAGPEGHFEKEEYLKQYSFFTAWQKLVERWVKPPDIGITEYSSSPRCTFASLMTFPPLAKALWYNNNNVEVYVECFLDCADTDMKNRPVQ
ncbi:hypothetical protein B0H14DRAFT_2623843 [Mycena olivaceomarginata]|nr:hypothetical protein B0H14DRAFT_2623843 [Mycena olivaceomarginata]